MPAKRFRQVESVAVSPRVAAANAARTEPSNQRHPLVEQLARVWPTSEWGEVTIVVAVSGGADSVALLRGLVELAPGRDGRIVAAHFNHHLRGAASDDDQAFVERVCGELRVPLELGQAHVAQIAQQRGDGLEAAAREARYSFLIETANRRSAGFVVTAHTADDQAETILHRVVRGTGLAGLAGIPPRRELRQELTLVRPLLAVRRTLILDYLETLGQTYREDESNVDRRFTRNRLRHELLENLREHYNPQVTEALLRLGTLAGEAQEVIAQLVGELMPQCTLADSPDHVAIDRTLLGERPRYLVRELLIAVWRRQHWPEQAMGFVEWDLLADMLLAEDAAPRQRMLPGCVTARRVGARLELSRAPARRQ